MTRSITDNLRSVALETTNLATIVLRLAIVVAGIGHFLIT